MIFGLLIAASLILKYFKKEGRARVILWIAIAWIFVVSSTPFSQWVVSTLERKYTVYQPSDFRGKRVNILILGGGHSVAPDLPAISQLSSPALQRLAEGIRLHRLIPGSKIICSGNSASKSIAQAEILANAALEFGVDPGDTLQNRLPQNTTEELAEYKKRFGSEAPLIVVTSALHMPRVMLLCKKMDLNAIPAPSNFFVKRNSSENNFDFQPYVLKMLMLEYALHEYAGILKIQLID